jgi:hypothetical protein
MRDVDAVDADSHCRERQRDPTGADREPHRTTACQLLENAKVEIVSSRWVVASS